jgi:hypothetical protein
VQRGGVQWLETRLAQHGLSSGTLSAPHGSSRLLTAPLGSSRLHSASLGSSRLLCSPLLLAAHDSRWWECWRRASHSHHLESCAAVKLATLPTIPTRLALPPPHASHRPGVPQCAACLVCLPRLGQAVYPRVGHAMGQRIPSTKRRSGRGVPCLPTPSHDHYHDTSPHPACLLPAKISTQGQATKEFNLGRA